jgi:hypothetical protein
MITGSYFRHQAETCLTLARTTTDRHTAAKLFEMAGQCMAKSDELDAPHLSQMRRYKIIGAKIPALPVGW